MLWILAWGLLFACPTCQEGAHFCTPGEVDPTVAVTWCCWDDAGGAQ